jgi:iron complex outermembrane receptor protein
MSRPIVCLLNLCVALLLAPSVAQGQTTNTQGSEEVNRALKSSSDLKKLSLEQIMDVEIWSVSRKEEKASEAAAAVYVITQEDIRRSGAVNIPEALRLAPGLEVARVNSHTWAISSRGFTATTSTKLQVLIDGRSVYSPLFSGVFWDVQDTLMEDIDRIEVIRGPGATLWGANAVNGVINVITKSAKETQGMLMTAGGGTEERVFGGFRYGGKIQEGVYYRIYGKGLERGATAMHDGQNGGDEWKRGQGGLRVDWDLSSVSTLTLQGDGYSGKSWDRTPFVSTNPPVQSLVHDQLDLKGGNILGRWTRTLGENSSFQAQMYYDRTHRSFPAIISEDRDVYDVDLQHRLPLGEWHDFVYGVGYDATTDRIQNSSSIGWDPSSRLLQVFSAFAQDDITLIADKLRLTLGSKFEHNSYSGFEYQPNGRIAWFPATNHTVWSSISRAVRTPSRLDRDIVNHGPLGAPFPPGSYTEILGSESFKPEELLALEFGYRVQPHPRLTLDLATFYNIYDNLRSFEFGSPSTISGVTVLPVVLANMLKGETYGGELGVGYQVLNSWRLSAGYTLLLEHLRFKAGSTDPTKGASEANDPTHQFFIRSYVDLPAHFEFDTSLRYVDQLPQPLVPSYLTMDVRLGWRPNDRWEVSLVSQNLLEKQHREFGAGVLAREIERSIYGKVTLRF